MRNFKVNWSNIGAVSTAILFFLVLNLMGSELLSRYRIDLTDNKLYTLSEGTVRILKNLREPVQLTYFVSKTELLELPGINAYADRVEDLLNEYKRLSDGRISLRTVEPQLYSEEEDLAVGHGLQGIPVGGGNFAYLGLIGTNSLDDTETISVFFPEREELLEYDLTKLVVQLADRERKTIGVISSLPIQGTGGFSPNPAGQSPPWTFFVQLNNFFDVQLLSSSDEELPDDLDILVLIHPQNLSDRLLYNIDQFVLDGNSLVVLVDPFSEILSAILGSLPQMPSLNTGSNLNSLMKNWGITLVEDKIVGDLPIAARVLEGDGSSGETIDYPVWMNIQPEQLSPDDVVTSQLGNIIMATAGTFETDAESSLVIEPLIKSSTAAKLYDYEEFSSITSIRKLLEGYLEGGEQLLMAARISGEAATAYPQGAPPSAKDIEEKIEPSQILKGQVNAIVVADTDFLHDRFWIRNQQLLGQTITFADASNGELIFNAIDNLSGDNNLIGVRSRGSYFRPFQRMQEIRQAAEQQYRQHELQLLEELKRTDNLLVDYGANQNSEQGERILTDDQREEIKRALQNKLEIRRELREVQRNLGMDIQQLETNIILLNVLVVPLFVAIFGVLAVTFGARRRQRKLVLDITNFIKTT